MAHGVNYYADLFSQVVPLTLHSYSGAWLAELAEWTMDGRPVYAVQEWDNLYSMWIWHASWVLVEEECEICLVTDGYGELILSWEPSFCAALSYQLSPARQRRYAMWLRTEGTSSRRFS